jgi:uncharacterized protein YajQ (UPF0234 family)
MAKDFSFDVVSDYDLSEMINAIDQVGRELQTRYDFQGTGAKCEFVRDAGTLELEANSDLKVQTILDVVESKLLKRGISLKVLDKSGEIVQSGMVSKLTVPLLKGLDQEKAKKITKQIRDEFPKAKAQIQGQEVRVSSTSKDDLQGIMNSLKAADFDFPVSFTNFR